MNLQSSGYEGRSMWRSSRARARASRTDQLGLHLIASPCKKPTCLTYDGGAVAANDGEGWF